MLFLPVLLYYIDAKSYDKLLIGWFRSALCKMMSLLVTRLKVIIC